MSNTISVYLLVPAIAWLVAQAAKILLALPKGEQANTPRQLFRSGNMPSAHSAVVVSLLTVIGFKDGLDSAVFGLATVLTTIVLYDAVNVRRAVGEQGNVLRKLVKSKQDADFFSADGHRLTEVIVGSLIGLVVAFGLLQIL